MAHHMLQTVLTQHTSPKDCYEGYLWAPFDTFLNIPRLMKFDRSRVWYHGVDGAVEYVDNPAFSQARSLRKVGEDQGGLGEGKDKWVVEDVNVDTNTTALRGHAPSARISPDPYGNVTEIWRHWGPDWWWGCVVVTLPHSLV